MNPLWIPLLSVAALGLVFVASLARREPIRLPRRFAGPKEEGALRVVHRGIAVHIGTGLACTVAVVSARDLPADLLALFFAAVLLVRVLGERIGRMRPRLARILAPLLAPVDGAALLLDWIVSPVLRSGGKPAAPHGERGEAYDHVLELAERTIEQVMTPRSEMVWLRAEAKLPEITETVRRRPHARYPVFEGDFEQSVGTVELVDLLDAPREDVTAAELARPAVVVPETIGCDDLLDRMRTDRFETAIVVDEFGGIAGLVTLEDLLEVLVGELMGEHEAVKIRARRIGEGAYIVEGTLRVEEFEDLSGFALPEGDYETLAGLFLSHVVRIPTRGEKLRVGDLRMEVVDADSRRIRKLKLVLPPVRSGSPGDPGAARRTTPRVRSG